MHSYRSLPKHCVHLQMCDRTLCTATDLCLHIVYSYMSVSENCVKLHVYVRTKCSATALCQNIAYSYRSVSAHCVQLQVWEYRIFCYRSVSEQFKHLEACILQVYTAAGLCKKILYSYRSVQVHCARNFVMFLVCSLTLCTATGLFQIIVYSYWSVLDYFAPLQLCARILFTALCSNMFI